MESLEEILLKLNQLCTTVPQSKCLVRKSIFEYKNQFKITSFIFQESAYFKLRQLPTLARGLFITEIQNKPQVIIRGYDKFFQINETPQTAWDHLKSDLKGPFDVTLKENGCIIFISALDGNLIVTSKHSLGFTRKDGWESHAIIGEKWLYKHLQTVSKSVDDLASFLSMENVTLVCELVDDDFEEHILEYSHNERGLYLHGINANDIHLKTWPINKVQSIATEYGFHPIQSVSFDTLEQVKEFSEKCQKSGTYNGKPVEGFVVRSTTQLGHAFFFKIKFDEPYLMFREFREATSSILRGMDKFKPKYELTFKYMAWVVSKKRSDPAFFNGFLENKGVIRARNTFLLESNLQGVIGETIISMCKQVDSTPIKPQMKPQMETLNLNSKILLLPIAIVGSGKTTLARILSKISPKSFKHIQSDDMPSKNTAKHFETAVMDAFEHVDVVFADKNNHLYQHRRNISQSFKSRYPGGTIIALDWQIESLDSNQVLEFCKQRILSRGENHQTLTPSQVPKVEPIIRMFIHKREPLDLHGHGDALIDLVIPMNLYQGLQTHASRVCDVLSWNLPSGDDWEDIQNQALTTVVTNKKPASLKPRVSYYGIGFPQLELCSMVSNVLSTLPGNTCPLWDSIQSKIKDRKDWHITLATRQAHESLFQKYHLEFQNRKQKRIQQENVQKKQKSNFRNEKGVFKQEVLTIDSILLQRLVWNDKCMAISVLLPKEIECGNDIPHITIGTCDESIPFSYSNQLLTFSKDQVGWIDLNWNVAGVLQSFY